jgi:murein DD-endopeptidase MepM/ murein hydrolase activator NlpD
VRHRTGITAVVLLTATLCTLAVGFGASAADAPGAAPQGRAAGFVLQVRIPGLAPITHAPAISRGGSASASGGYATQPDPSIASVLTSDTSVGVEATAVASRGDVTTRAAGVTLLDGLITAQTITSQAAALAATTTEAQSALQTSVEGLVVAGQPLEATPNRIIAISGVGDLVVEESVDAVRGPQSARAFAIALHLRIRQEYRGLPAGTEILVGYADAGAAVPDPTSLSTPDPLAAPTAPITPLPPTYAGDTQDPPPGGFTTTPPIDQERVDQLLDGTYMFPVLGATANDFSDDFGAPRATTGFHQGIDIFAASGTPILAINDGVLSNVGTNNYGGRRFWLTDRYGNQFYFAHLAGFSPLAKEGAQVKRGDVIGFVGNSGDAITTPPHLHFEMHPGGGWAVPPYQYMLSWLTGVRQPVVATPQVTVPTTTVTVPATAPAKPKPKPKPKPIETLPVTTPAPATTQAPAATAPAPPGTTAPAPPATTAPAPPATTAPATTAPTPTDTTSTGATTAAVTGTGTVFSG